MTEHEIEERERQCLRRVQALEQELYRRLREEEGRGQERLERLLTRKSTRRAHYEEAIQRYYSQSAALRAEALALRAEASALRAEASALRGHLERLRASWFYKPFALLRRVEEVIRGRRPSAVTEANAPAGSTGLRFDIDTLADSIFRGSGDISGWCLNLAGAPPRAIRARVAEQTFDGVYGTTRPGIRLGFPNVPGSDKCGYRVRLELPEGNHDVVLEALLEGDRWQEFAHFPILSMAPLPPRFHFWLDAPRGYRVALSPGEELTISGWCVASAGGQTYGIRAWLNETLFPGEHGLPRPDVCRLLPDVPYAGDGGFIVRARVAPGRYRCRIQAKDSAGAWQDVVMREWHVYHGAVETGELPATAPSATLPDAAAYRRWFERTRPAPDALEEQRRAAAAWDDAPLLSVVIPAYNSPPTWFGELLDSLRRQSYPRFECVIVDDASTRREHVQIAQRVAREDARFRVLEQAENRGVGGATRAGADACGGDYVLVVDHDDLLEPDALYEIAAAARTRRAAVIYSDEVLADDHGAVIAAALRPAFNYAYLLSHPYIVHLAAVRRDLLTAAGGHDPHLPISQDYDLLLRIAALTRDFHHVPKALYRWRIHSASTGHRHAGLVMDISRQALRQHLRLTGRNEAEAWVEDGPVMNSFRVRHLVAPAKVSVVVLADDEASGVAHCVRCFWERTRFPEGVVAELTLAGPAGKLDAELQRLQYRTVELPPDGPVAARLNAAAAATDGELLLFLDAGATPADESWLAALLEPFAETDVAAVGAKLVNPRTGLVEHAGVVAGFGGTAELEYRGFPEQEGGLPFPGHGHGLVSMRDCSALSGACLMLRRSAFEQAGGFDAGYERAFHDFDLGLRLRTQRGRCVFTPHARLLWEGPGPAPEADRARFAGRWADALRAGDPFYNPNLARAGRMFWPAA